MGSVLAFAVALVVYPALRSYKSESGGPSTFVEARRSRLQG
ncbi:MAG TPA: hypothetical protein VF528_06540 [Pyrinomonadaceae bacterium]